MVASANPIVETIQQVMQAPVYTHLSVPVPATTLASTEVPASTVAAALPTVETAPQTTVIPETLPPTPSLSFRPPASSVSSVPGPTIPTVYGALMTPAPVPEVS